MKTKKQIAKSQRMKYLSRIEYYKKKARDRYHLVKYRRTDCVLNKLCPSCNKMLSSYNFTKATHHSNGLRTYCKTCTNIKNREQWHKHKQKRTKYSKQYRKENIEALRKQKREYAKTNLLLRRRLERERFHRIRGNGGSYKEEEWDELLDKDGNKCLKCASKENITRDHVVPVIRGGSSNIDNLQPLCGNCNSWKKDKIIDYRI